MTRAAAHRGGPVDGDADVALARAERAGAAPGTEFRGAVAVESSPVRGGARRAHRSGIIGVAALACLATAAWYGGHATYIHAKAQFGQWLLDRAWHDARREGGDVKPWPWADTHPVARLTVPARGVDVLVLAGANGRTLAWAPGHLDGTAVPGTRGNAVVTAHRDTHFAFLRDLAPGDHIVAQARDGTTRSYEVETTFVADAKSLSLPADPLGTTLSLVTCFPFDAVDPGTPLRYAVIARGDGDATSTGPRAADASGSAGARAPAGPRPRSRG